MVDVISVENMRNSDAAAINGGIPSLELMRRAAQGIFDLSDLKGKTVIVVGSGNNGGDGFALASIMADSGNIPDIVTVTDHYSPDSTYYMNEAVVRSVKILPFRKGEGIFEQYDSIVDCLLGTGTKGDVRGVYKDVIEEINTAGQSCYVVSADINSGLNGDTGEGSCAVKSDLTVSIGSHKRGVVLSYGSNAGFISELVACDIGIRIDNREDYFLSDGEWREMGFPEEERIHREQAVYYR